MFNINYQTCTNILVVASCKFAEIYLKDPYSLAINDQSFVYPINDIAEIYIYTAVQQ